MHFRLQYICCSQLTPHFIFHSILLSLLIYSSLLQIALPLQTPFHTSSWSFRSFSLYPSSPVPHCWSSKSPQSGLHGWIDTSANTKCIIRLCIKPSASPASSVFSSQAGLRLHASKLTSAAGTQKQKTRNWHFKLTFLGFHYKRKTNLLFWWKENI